MTKLDFIDAIAEESKLSKADSKKALDAFIKVTSAALKSGSRIPIVGLGTFSITERAERTGRNPKTGQSLTIKAKKVVKFKAGTELAGLAI